MVSRILSYKNRNAHIGDILAVVCVILVLAGYIMRPFYAGPGHLDESYQALCVTRWLEAPLAMFLFWKGHVWTKVFGDSYLSLRFLSCLITLMSIGVSCWYLGWRTSSVRNGLWMFVLCGVLGLIETHLMYNWDVGPTFLYSLCAILSLEYIRTRKLWLLIIFAVAVCLLGLSRVQLFVLAPLCLAFVWLATGKRNKHNNQVCAILVYMISYMLAFCIVTTLMTGSPQAYIEAFVPENVITGHSVSHLGRFISIPVFFLGMYTVQQFICIIVICLGIWYFYGKKIQLKNYIVFFSAVIAGSIMAVYMDDEFGLECGWGSTGLSLMVFVLLMPVLHNVIRGEKARYRDLTMALSMLWIWFLVPGFGSDNFMSHFNAYGLLPVACAVAYQWLTQKQIKLLRGVLIIALVAFSTTVVIRTYNIITYTTVSLADLPKMQGLHANEISRQEILETYEVVTVLDSIGCSDKLNFDGNRYLFNYTMQKAPVSDLQNFHPQDRQYEIDRRKEAARLYDAWLFHTVTHDYMEGLDTMLVNEGFVCVENRIDSGLYKEEHRGMVLYLREPFASRYHAFTRK